MYDVTPNDQRFVMIRLQAEGGRDDTQLIVVENFFEELKERTGGTINGSAGRLALDGQTQKVGGSQRPSDLRTQRTGYAIRTRWPNVPCSPRAVNGAAVLAVGLRRTHQLYADLCNNGVIEQ